MEESEEKKPQWSSKDQVSHLKGEKYTIFEHKILEGNFGQPQRSANHMWDKMTYVIRKDVNFGPLNVSLTTFNPYF